MNPTRSPLPHPGHLLRGLLLAAAVLCTPLRPWAASTDLASSPLETSTATLVKPNILFILDDSGSMSYPYLPTGPATTAARPSSTRTPSSTASTTTRR